MEWNGVQDSAKNDGLSGGLGDVGEEDDSKPNVHPRFRILETPKRNKNCPYCHGTGYISQKLGDGTRIDINCPECPDETRWDH